MSKTSNARRKGLAVLATSALVAGASLAGAGSAHAVADFKFKRLGGTDRYETASLVADEFAATNKTVILANGEPGNYADALSANTLAGELSAPILLTRTDKTPKFTLDQLKEDGVTDIYVVGGVGVVSAAQVSSLEGMGYKVTRVAGSDRFLTNAEVIKMNGTAKGATGLIATGFNFPDALAAGPISYQGHPLGLSATNNIEDSVVNALKAAGVTKVLIFGGESVVGPGVVAKLAANGITVEKRFAGADRSDTSQAAAEYALANLGFSNKHLGVASGYVQGFGADALAGGPLEGKEMAPMLVTRDVNNPDDVVDFMKDHSNTLETGHLFGGTGAISASAQAAMEAAAKSVTSNATLSVTPANDTSLTVATEPSTDDDRTYTVNGLDDTKAYTVSLFPSENVTKDANGVYTFKDTTGAADKADDEGSAPAADITRTNNSPITAADTAQVVPVNGTINFTIDGVAPGSVTPVVYLNEGTAGLDLNAKNEPTEKFGVGGKTTYKAIAAGNRTMTDVTVSSVDKAADTFEGTDTTPAMSGAMTYKYDSNDSYKVDGVSVGMAAFEAALSTGDNVAGTYTTDPAGVSQFNLTDDSPGTPSAVSAEKGAGQASDDITVTITPGASSYDSIVIQRAPVTGGTDEANDGTVGTYTTIAQPTTDADSVAANFQYVDMNVPAGVYRYRAALVKDGDQGAFTADANNESSVAPSTDNTAPRATDARVATNTGNPLLINDGDSFKVVFDEVMAAPTANDTIRVTDTDGSVYDLVNGSGVTYSLNSGTEDVGGTVYAAGRVLTVAITTLPGAATPGTVAGLNIPATITQQSGTTDTNGNQWSLAGSSDLVIDQE